MWSRWWLALEGLPQRKHCINNRRKSPHVHEHEVGIRLGGKGSDTVKAVRGEGSVTVKAVRGGRSFQVAELLLLSRDIHRLAWGSSGENVV